LDRERRTVALMDMGTNTELLLVHEGKCWAASCPAGPAFEGGEISCGSPALDGAVERAHLHTDGHWSMEVLGGKQATGICGSGLVDVLSELLRTERMNSLGRFAGEEERISIDAEERIYIEENDVSLLAQSKGANIAGLNIVLDTCGIDFKDLDIFYLAGGFARHLDVAAAKRIGLIPDIQDEKIHKIGNASIEGATVTLRSVSRRAELERWLRDIKHVELEKHPSFFEYFVEACQFVPCATRQMGEVG